MKNIVILLLKMVGMLTYTQASRLLGTRLFLKEKVPAGAVLGDY